MCCFSRPVDAVFGTNIFARTSKKERQYLVYSMSIKAKEDLAMILPIPVPEDVKEDAVRFISLEKYPDFFKDLRKGFPPSRGLGHGDSKGPVSGNKLKVVEVGSFAASFVPTVKDFRRLDEQFRLPDKVWDDLPMYKDYGFVVFKLRKGATKVHPMAFEFPRADPKQLFFPTVHIHDGKVHDKAPFDHALFCQRVADEKALLFKWQESPQPAGMFMNVEKAKGLILKDNHVYLMELKGKLKNEDVFA